MTSVKKIASKKTNLQSLNAKGSSSRSPSVKNRGHVHLCKVCDDAIAEPDTKIKGDDSIFTMVNVMIGSIDIVQA